MVEAERGVEGGRCQMNGGEIGGGEVSSENELQKGSQKKKMMKFEMTLLLFSPRIEGDKKTTRSSLESV